MKRALFVATLGILSRYCAAMAEVARRETLWAHQRAVELRALAPYLEPFPDDIRLKVRERLVDRYFGVGSTLLAESVAKTPPATATHDQVISTVRTLLDRLASSSEGAAEGLGAPRSSPQPKGVSSNQIEAARLSAAGTLGVVLVEPVARSGYGLRQRSLR